MATGYHPHYASARAAIYNHDVAPPEQRPTGPTPHITLRPATVADAGPLSRFAARTFDEAFGSDSDRADVDAYLAEAFRPEVQAAEITEPGAFVLLAESDGTLVGYVHMCDSEPPACIRQRPALELKRLYVDQMCQGTGLGGRLLRAGVAHARDAGAAAVWLGVWERNTRAQRLYAREGFVRAGEHVFQLGRDPQTDWVMVKPVNL